MVTLYLIRHAEAVPPGDPNYEDDDRPLTPAGRVTARGLGAALAAKGIKFDAVLTSPLPRAKQTAEELLAGYGEGAAELQEMDELAPGEKPRRLDKRLLKIEGDSIALDSGLLLPLVEVCVRHIDLAAGRILVAPGFSDPD